MVTAASRGRGPYYRISIKLSELVEKPEQSRKPSVNLCSASAVDRVPATGPLGTRHTGSRDVSALQRVASAAASGSGRICGAAGHRRDARADRRARSRRERSGDDPAADDRGLPPLRTARLYQRATRLGGACDGLDRNDRLPRLARRRAPAAPAGPRRSSTPRSRSGRRGSTSSAASPTHRSCAAGACGSRTRARSSPITGAAPPTSRTHARRSTQSPSRPRSRRPRGPLGSQGDGGAAAGPDRQGPRRAHAARRPQLLRRRSTPATTSPTSTPSGRCASSAGGHGSGTRSASGVRSEDGPPAIEEEADLVVAGTEGVRELLSALIAE